MPLKGSWVIGRSLMLIMCDNKRPKFALVAFESREWCFSIWIAKGTVVGKWPN